MFTNNENILDEYSLEMKYENEKRRVRVLLPKSYKKTKAKKYPVVYFHDGQNIFFDEESYSGISWGLLKTIRDNKDLDEFISVGIDNSSDRMAEYSPWDFTYDLEDLDIEKAEGTAYADFVINTVKPFIDRTYRTKKSKKFTYMIGSSAGANITAFMGKKYQGKLGGLGIFSLASFIFKDDFKSYIKGSKLKANQKIYINVGTDEMEASDLSQAYIDQSISYQEDLIKAGIPLENIRLKIIKGHTHSEKDWAKNLKECLVFLFNR